MWSVEWCGGVWCCVVYVVFIHFIASYVSAKNLYIRLSNILNIIIATVQMHAMHNYETDYIPV